MVARRGGIVAKRKPKAETPAGFDRIDARAGSNALAELLAMALSLESGGRVSKADAVKVALEEAAAKRKIRVKP